MSIWLEVGDPHARCEIVQLFLFVQRAEHYFGGTNGGARIQTLSCQYFDNEKRYTQIK